MTAANAVAAVVRFAILRTWVFRPEFGTHLALPAGPTPEPGAPAMHSGRRRHKDVAVTEIASDDRTPPSAPSCDGPVTAVRRRHRHHGAAEPAHRRLAPAGPTSVSTATAPTPEGTEPPAVPPAPGPPAAPAAGWPDWSGASPRIRLGPTRPLRSAGGHRVPLPLGTRSAPDGATASTPPPSRPGTKSWKAFFFGSSDASNFITVDKPPAALWVMEISARIFGVNSWSILVPQALEGVATVGLLYVTVRRWFAPGAALLAGAVLALTPVATLMFRFNNPDALLTLLLTGAAYATVRAVEDGRTRWMVLAGTLVGFGFITKMLQAIILMPVLALVYLLAGPPKLGRRVRPGRLLGRGPGGGRRLVGGGRPADAGRRPALHRRVDRQQPVEPHLRLQRLRPPHRQRDRQRRRGLRRPAGGEHVGPGGMEPPVPPGDGRPDLVAHPGCPHRPGGRPVDDPARPADRPGPGRIPRLRGLAPGDRGHPQLRPRDHPPLLHDRLAPAVGALVGMGAATLWHRRHEIFPRVALALAIVATIAWAFVILGLEPDWYPALRWVILAVGVVAAVGIALVPRRPGACWPPGSPASASPRSSPHRRPTP